MFVDSVESALLQSINSGVASQETDPHTLVKQLFQSKSSIVHHLPTLATLISLYIFFLKPELRQLLS
jgi:hypothetical protein